MPIIPNRRENKDGEKVDVYEWPARYVTPMAGIAPTLRLWRKNFIKDQEEFLAHQKSCGREDRDGAKFFRECARESLKKQRACTLMIPAFGEPDKDKDCEGHEFWPVELAPELDEISRQIILEFG